MRNVLLVGALVASNYLFGQLQVTGDFRTLGEVRHGYMQPAVDTSVAASFVSQRSRIGLSYKKDQLSLKFSVQDVRTWGEDDTYTASGTFGDSHSLQTAESWMQYNVTDSLFVRLGRQVWAYDEQRILSGRDRNQNGLYYDALLLSFTQKHFQADLGLSFNNTGQNLYNIDYYNDMNKIQSQNFLYLNHSLSDAFRWSALGLATAYNDPFSRNNLHFMYTGGLTGTVLVSDATLHAEAYYQDGKNNKGADVSAYFITFKADYKLFDGKIIPGLGVDYFSGHNANNADTEYATVDHTFDIMYGARYKFNGNMNQFMFVGKPYEKGGLQDLYATIDFKPGKKHIIKTQLHRFSLSNIYPSATSTVDQFDKLDSELATELDLVYVYKINKEAKVNIGGAYLLATESLEYLKGQASQASAPSYYLWASFQFTPEIFNSSK